MKQQLRHEAQRRMYRGEGHHVAAPEGNITHIVGVPFEDSPVSEILAQTAARTAESITGRPHQVRPLVDNEVVYVSDEIGGWERQVHRDDGVIHRMERT